MTEQNRTLFFLKTDATIRPYVGARILKEILDASFEPLAFQELKLSVDFLSNYHYAIHKGRFFFQWLLDYVSLFPTVALILQGSDTILELRRILGPTFPEKAAIDAPNSLRARYGIFGGVNGCHASDSETTAASEILTWQTHGYLRSSADATHRAESYVDDNLDLPYVDSMRYRELSNAIVGNPDEKADVRNKFLSLLKQEVHKANSQVVHQFAESLVANSLLGR